MLGCSLEMRLQFGGNRWFGPQEHILRVCYEVKKSVDRRTKRVRWNAYTTNVAHAPIPREEDQVTQPD